MLKLILKKMLHNVWLMACLLGGCILVMAIISSIPMYVNGVLQRMLIKDMEQLHGKAGEYPGNYLIAASALSKDSFDVMELDRIVDEKIYPSIEFTVFERSRQLTLQYLTLLNDEKKTPTIRTVSMSSMKDLEEHCNLKIGEFYSDKIEDNIIEAVATRKVFQRYSLGVGDIFELKSQTEGILPYKVKITGIIEAKDPNEHYWISKLDSYEQQIFINDQVLVDEFIKQYNGIDFYGAKWKFAFDYRQLSVHNLKRVTRTFRNHSKSFENYAGVANHVVVMRILKEYDEKRIQLTKTLWMLLSPVFCMLLFYLFMVSQLIIKKDGTEIAVYKSRGATGSQILLKYLLESIILISIAIIIGVPLGHYFCRVIGATNGFLSFVNRKALDITLSYESYTYCLLAGVLMVLAMMFPAYEASKKTIVHQKQGSLRKSKKPLWKKIYLDFVIFALSFYGIYQYNSKLEVADKAGMNIMSFQIDPLVFFTATLFIIGAGMIFLRLYPYIIKIVFKIVKRRCSPEFFMSFAQISRSKGQEQFIMLFMIFVMGVGIYSANAARTINQNMADRLKYKTGSEIKLVEEWFRPGYLPPEVAVSEEERKLANSRYDEPPFSRYTELNGIEKATKVYVQTRTTGTYNSMNLENMKLLGIVPDEFSEVAWFRKDLFPYHQNTFLNVLIDSPEAILVSKGMADKYAMTLGDRLSFYIGDELIEGTIAGFIEYWPTYNPYDSYGNKINNLIVANIEYIFKGRMKMPYEVWLSKKEGITDKELYDEIYKKDYDILALENVNQELLKRMKDPMLQGFNGALTVAFLSTMVICLMGYLIYWTMALDERTLQFGVIRALGLSKPKVYRMLIYEQVIICGIALVAGVAIGGLASDLFVPLLQGVFNAVDKVPPFMIIFDRSDYMKVYVVVAMMLILGISLLGKVIGKMNIGQALKLGED